MRTTTRAWFAASLLLLVCAALLHTVELLGLRDVWAALVHLTLFGWVSAMILAVNYHTMPVFTGRDFPAAALIWAHLGTFVGGVGLATGGLLGGATALVAAGLALELAGALLFALNVALLLRRGGPRRARPPAPIPGQQAVDRVCSRATATAGLCLPLSLLLLLAARLGLIGGSWWLAGEHLATLGWVMLMIVGVAQHMLPRFSGRPTRGARPALAQLGLHLLALALILAGLGAGWSAVFAAGGLAMAGALGLFAWTIWPALRPAAPAAALIIPTVKEFPR